MSLTPSLPESTVARILVTERALALRREASVALGRSLDFVVDEPFTDGMRIRLVEMASTNFAGAKAFPATGATVFIAESILLRHAECQFIVDFFGRPEQLGSHCAVDFGLRCQLRPYTEDEVAILEHQAGMVASFAIRNARGSS